jgi:hypothetical protein
MPGRWEWREEPPRLAWRSTSQEHLCDRTQRVGVGVESPGVSDMNLYAALGLQTCPTILLLNKSGETF